MIQAFVTAADDVLFSVNGKLTIIGVYTNDIVIPTELHAVAQLVFLFHIEGDELHMPKALRLEVSIPGQAARYVDVPLGSEGIQMFPGRTRWTVQMPVVVNPAILKPGKIITRVYADGIPIDVAGPWVTTLSISWPPPSSQSLVSQP